MKFRKIPVVIEAEQWFGHAQSMGVDLCDIKEFFTRVSWTCKHCGDSAVHHGWIGTLEGGHIVCSGDWIIKGVKGEFYPCKPDIFDLTYGAVDAVSETPDYKAIAGRLAEALESVQRLADESYKCRYESYHVEDLVACLEKMHDRARKALAEWRAAGEGE